MLRIGETSQEKSRVLELTVYYQENFDYALATAMLSALGLSRTALVQAFSKRYYDCQFVLKLVQGFREQAKLAEYAREARLHGKVLVTVYVEPFIIIQIAEFLTDILKTAALHLADAQYQQLTGLTYAAVGGLKNIKEAGGNIGSGVKKALAGFWDGNVNSVGSPAFQKGWENFFNGLAQIGFGYTKLSLQTPLDAFLTVALKSADSFTTMFGLEGVGRLLTTAEINLLTPIFASSIEYGAIRIKEGYAGILNAGDDGGLKIINNQRPITIGNTIYMKDKIPVMPNHASTLVHETTHVWQHQNGGTDYMSEALFAQMTTGYGFEDDVLKNKKTWAMLNPEQQGQFVQNAYQFGYFKTPKQWNDPNITNQSDKQLLILAFDKVLLQLKAGQGAT